MMPEEDVSSPLLSRSTGPQLICVNVNTEPFRKQNFDVTSTWVTLCMEERLYTWTA